MVPPIGSTIRLDEKVVGKITTTATEIAFELGVVAPLQASQVGTGRKFDLFVRF